MAIRLQIMAVTLALALAGPAEAGFWEDLEEAIGIARQQAAESAGKQAEPPQATPPARKPVEAAPQRGTGPAKVDEGKGRAKPRKSNGPG